MSAIGNIISFARECYLHWHTPDMFLKASAVALHLSARLNWDWAYDEAKVFHRPQLQELLRDLSRFLRQCNEDSVKHEERSMSKLVYGLALLAEKELLVEVEEYPERGHREAAGMMDVELMVLSLSDLAACG